MAKKDHTWDWLGKPGRRKRKLFSSSSPRATQRAQNVCRTCTYTWFPRGKGRSLRCPNCGESDIKVASGCGCCGPAVAGILIAFFGMLATASLLIFSAFL